MLSNNNVYDLNNLYNDVFITFFCGYVYFLEEGRTDF